MRNFKKWDKVVHPGMVLDNLKLKHKGLIDADSQFQVVGIKEIKKPASAQQINNSITIQTQLF